MSLHYDSLPLNEDILLDLPFREGTGVITQDVAKPHHPITMVGDPTWTELDTGLTVLTLDGATQYLYSENDETEDLEFTDGDYSIGAWIKWQAGGEDSQIVIGRYQVDVGGWEIYLYSTGSLTERHHHAGGDALRSACYSMGWTYDTWHFMGISRSGATGIHYRNGVPLAMLGTMEDPEATTQDLVIGVRFNKSDNEYKGPLWRPRVWGRALSGIEWLQEYERTKGWFA